MLSTNSRAVAAFRYAVWSYYKKNGRHDLPWRKIFDRPLPAGRQAYNILVSEVMLQQTQVPRVIGKYTAFIKKFPTVRALARAPLSAVLKEWSGLGYNRRAKYLHDAAKLIVKIPIHNKGPAGPLLCKGVGSYTRAAVRVFAYNEPHVLIETNIRTVYLHHFFADKSDVSDAEIVPLAEAAMPKGSPPAGGPREWHWALMDYGAHLKKTGVRNNHRSAHYTRQSKFEGSLREIRGTVLRRLVTGQPINDLRSRYSERFGEALKSLQRDGLIKQEKGRWRIA